MTGKVEVALFSGRIALCTNAAVRCLQSFVVGYSYLTSIFIRV